MLIFIIRYQTTFVLSTIHIFLFNFSFEEKGKNSLRACQLDYLKRAESLVMRVLVTPSNYDSHAIWNLEFSLIQMLVSITHSCTALDGNPHGLCYLCWTGSCLSLTACSVIRIGDQSYEWVAVYCSVDGSGLDVDQHSFRSCGELMCCSCNCKYSIDVFIGGWSFVHALVFVRCVFILSLVIQLLLYFLYILEAKLFREGSSRLSCSIRCTGIPISPHS